MWVRWTGLALVLVMVGGGAGYAIGRAQVAEPTIASDAAPLPARSPSYPHNVYDVVADPRAAPLATDLPLRTTSFSTGGLRMTARVPKGWHREPLEGRDTWNFAPPAYVEHTYVLRVGIIAGDRASLTVARNFRIGALEDAEANGDMQRVVIEESEDGLLVATYISDRHQRVTMQRWLPKHDSTQAFATVAVTGRESDREGMADLLERVAASADY